MLDLITLPPLVDTDHFPEDAKNRAITILASIKGGSVWSYSDRPGLEVIRRHVVENIMDMDGGIECDMRIIILCAGASEVRYLC